jgi:hypothetical protein
VLAPSLVAPLTDQLVYDALTGQVLGGKGFLRRVIGLIKGLQADATGVSESVS